MNQEASLTGLSSIRWSATNHIGELILNRPPSNEMNAVFFEELDRLLPYATTRKDLLGIIVSGAGRHFSSGMALDELLKNITVSEISDHPGDKKDHVLLQNYRSFLRLKATPIPVVAAIRGVCLGSAFELALLCHFRICTPEAVFGLPETTFNLMPGLGGIRRMSELAGKAHAIELILHGNTFSAEEALALNLVDAIVPKNELHETAASFIRKISENYRKEKRPLYLTRYLRHHGTAEDTTL